MARSATRPIVGVTSYAPDVVEWGPWHEPAIIIPSSYVRALTNAGARPLIVPPDYGSAEQTLDLLDAVVFSGGTDIVAVCRGSQLLNVARGGDLVQHLPDEVGHDGHRPRPGTFIDHDVRLKPESVLAGILGRRVPVKSHHHQGFGRLGRGLDAVGWAEDGTVEALEDSSRRFALGVLWHPEEAEDLALFDALVASARAYRAARGR